MLGLGGSGRNEFSLSAFLLKPFLPCFEFLQLNH